MVITTLATAAERFDAALENLSLAIDEMDDHSARSSEELELEGNLSLLGEAEQLLAKLKELQPPAAMSAPAPVGTRNDFVLHQLMEKLTKHVVSPPPLPSTSVKIPTLTIPTLSRPCCKKVIHTHEFLSTLYYPMEQLAIRHPEQHITPQV